MITMFVQMNIEADRSTKKHNKKKQRKKILYKQTFKSA